MQNFNPVIETQNDNLIIPEVRQWSEEKYRLLGAYCDIFTTSMRQKWSELVYIDLFAGAGYSKIKETDKIVKSSSLIAMSLPFKFTKYILCEQDEEKFNALSQRVKKEFPQLNVTLINGDSNKMIGEIRKAIPQFSKERRVLSFCFVDPFSLNLNFNTINTLSKGINIDFLILLALGMDANRNFKIYLDEESNKIERFIDNIEWRREFEKASGQDFITFLGKKYDENMTKLGYVKPCEKDKHLIKSNTKHLPLYHLAFYSKHQLGTTFFSKIKSYSNSQLEIF